MAKKVASLAKPGEQGFRLRLEDGTVVYEAKTAEEAQKFLDTHYSGKEIDRYSSNKPDKPNKSEESEKPEKKVHYASEDLPIFITSGNKGVDRLIGSAAPSRSVQNAYNRIGMDPFFNDVRQEVNERAWKENPEFMQAVVTDTGNFVGGVASLPIIATAYSASPLIAGAMNLYGAYEGAKRLTSDEGVAKTYDKFSQGDWKGGFKSLAGDAWDVAISLPALRGIRQGMNMAKNTAEAGARKITGDYVANEFSKRSPYYDFQFDWRTGKFHLTPKYYGGSEEVVSVATPRILPEQVNNTLKPAEEVVPTIISEQSEIRGLLNAPTSGKTNYGSTISLPSSSNTFYMDSPEANLEFIKKFNKWNKRYGYPMLSKDLAKDGNALNDAVKERLNQHNTFVRGAFIDSKAGQNYDQLIDQMKKQGIEPTQDNILEFLATHYLPETGHGGRAGFYNIPDVQRHRNGDAKNQIGTIYTSNSLDTAAGYANRNGRRQYRGVFIVRRPISFEGSREDWVKNADFPLFSYGNDKSNLYYQYELPYLMATGKAVPKKAIVDFDAVNEQLKQISDPEMGKPEYSWINSVYKSHNRTPKISNFGIGSGFLNYRVGKIGNLLRSLQDKEGDIMALQELSPELSPEDFQNINNYFLYPPKVLDKFETIVNSRNYQNAQYRQFKEAYDKRRKEIISQNLKFPKEGDIIQTVLESGVTPSAPVTNIGTSEKLKTATINADPSEVYQHFIFTGAPWEKGLEVVERVPYSEWKHINGSTAHRGEWTPGLSRKSKKNGGKLIKKKFKINGKKTYK